MKSCLLIVENVNNGKAYKIIKTSLKIDYFHSSIPQCRPLLKVWPEWLNSHLSVSFLYICKGGLYIIIIRCSICLQVEVIDYCSATCLFSVTIHERHPARSVLQIHFILFKGCRAFPVWRAWYIEQAPISRHERYFQLSPATMLMDISLNSFI